MSSSGAGTRGGWCGHAVTIADIRRAERRGVTAAVHPRVNPRLGSSAKADAADSYDLRPSAGRRLRHEAVVSGVMDAEWFVELAPERRHHIVHAPLRAHRHDAAAHA